jgi:two-component system sensor histidine kinase YesM
MNIHRRLILAYGEDSGLHLSKSELGGLKVTIQIKLDGRMKDDAPSVDRG